jgi:hypothetical protein
MKNFAGVLAMLTILPGATVSVVGVMLADPFS